MFKVGDKVRWQSQSSSSMTEKVGEIVAVVPSNESLRYFRTIIGKYRRLGVFGMSRNHESYLVAVPSKTGRGKPVLYWPRVRHLRKVD